MEKDPKNNLDNCKKKTHTLKISFVNHCSNFDFGNLFGSLAIGHGSSKGFPNDFDVGQKSGGSPRVFTGKYSSDHEVLINFSIRSISFQVTDLLPELLALDS